MFYNVSDILSWHCGTWSPSASEVTQKYVGNKPGLNLKKHNTVWILCSISTHLTTNRMYLRYDVSTKLHNYIHTQETIRLEEYVDENGANQTRRQIMTSTICRNIKTFLVQHWMYSLLNNLGPRQNWRYFADIIKCIPAPCHPIKYAFVTCDVTMIGCEKDWDGRK